MSKITWLHLSDLHFRVDESNKNHTWDQDLVLKKLLEDIRQRREENAIFPDFIVVTGDVAFSGSKEEYTLAKAFLDDLLKAAGLVGKKDRLFIVPGNHDVDRSAITRGVIGMAASLKDEESVNEVLASKGDRSLLLKRLKKFGKFVKGYFEECLLFDQNHYFYEKILPVGEHKVAVLGLNSAILARGEGEEYGKLVLGERQVKEVLEKVPKADLYIALMHHPFDWYWKFDRDHCMPMLMEKCDFILHGHLHDAGLGLESTPDASSMIVAAGACYETRQSRNSYNYVQLDLKTGRGILFLRMFSDRSGGFWTEDTQTYKNAKNGQYKFQFSVSAKKSAKKNRKKGPSVPRIKDIDMSLLEENYLQRMQEICNALPLGTIDPLAAERTRVHIMNLQSLYVGLNTRSIIQEMDESGWKIKNKKGKVTLKLQTETKSLSALQAVDREREIVLLGDPGSGKSTFANYLALCLAGARLEEMGKSKPEFGEKWLKKIEPEWTHGALLPIRVTLRDFAASRHCTGKSAGIWGFLADCLTDECFPELTAYLRKQALAGGVLFLFDGLDEVAEPRMREAVRDTLVDFVRSHRDPQNRYLVTGRTYAYQDTTWQLKGFAAHTLASLNQDQIDTLVSHWYEETCRLGWKNRSEAKELTHWLQTAAKRPDLMPLAVNPLQLTMMASLQFSWGKLPDDRVDLYQEMVRLLLVRWQEGRLGKESGITKIVGAKTLESALERVAFVAHNSQGNPEGVADIAESQLLEVLQDSLEGSWDKASEVAKYIKERAGLLVERGPGMYAFPHRSYQEYLAGAFLAVQDNFPDDAASFAHENYGQWREVVLWAVGIMSRTKKMIHVAVDVVDALCFDDVPGEDISEKAWRAANLAGEALLEIGLDTVRARSRYEKIISRVRKWLVEWLERGVLAQGERVVAGNTLAKLGDPRFRADTWYLPDEPLLGFMEVPEGSFLIGSDKNRDKEAYDAEMPQHEVYLSTYYMAKYLVTVAQFKAFVQESGHKPKDEDSLKGLENHPVVYVSWNDARAYCRWLTVQLKNSPATPEPIARRVQKEQWEIRLPTEAEWEKAARGPDGHIYPWGDQVDPNKANYGDTGIGTTSAVGCFPGGASPFGCLDMAGNVWEWTGSIFKPYLDTPEDKQEDLKGKSPGAARGGVLQLS
ncbi:MAG: SUMF1/EgtB/PvdO family nonheme iron enzyme [Deltaproteobacteria bacterium]|nr:SUMF1/EgtB/PvdO family nonheme iron enzyme [Deltaproteobacteria bacterium]